jgi:hypothetical protein
MSSSFGERGSIAHLSGSTDYSTTAGGDRFQTSPLGTKVPFMGI